MGKDQTTTQTSLPEPTPQQLGLQQALMELLGGPGAATSLFAEEQVPGRIAGLEGPAPLDPRIASMLNFTAGLVPTYQQVAGQALLGMFGNGEPGPLGTPQLNLTGELDRIIGATKAGHSQGIDFGPVLTGPSEDTLAKAGSVRDLIDSFLQRALAGDLIRIPETGGEGEGDGSPSGAPGDDGSGSGTHGEPSGSGADPTGPGNPGDPGGFGAPSEPSPGSQGIGTNQGGPGPDVSPDAPAPGERGAPSFPERRRLVYDPTLLFDPLAERSDR